MSIQISETVEPGTWVKVRGLVPGVDTTIHFVCENEVNYDRHKLPSESFLGEALVDAKVGDRVQLDAFDNDQFDDERMELTVLAVGQD
jgi:transcription elongation GreA/GreB family factor